MFVKSTGNAGDDSRDAGAHARQGIAAKLEQLLCVCRHFFSLELIVKQGGRKKNSGKRARKEVIEKGKRNKL